MKFVVFTCISSILLLATNGIAQDSVEDESSVHYIRIQYSPYNLTINKNGISNVSTGMFGTHGNHYRGSWDINAIYTLTKLERFNFDFGLGYHRYSVERFDDNPSVSGWQYTDTADPDVIRNTTNEFDVDAIRFSTRFGYNFIKREKIQCSAFIGIGCLWYQRQFGSTINSYFGGYKTEIPYKSSMQPYGSLELLGGSRASYSITPKLGISLEGRYNSTKIPTYFGFKGGVSQYERTSRKEISISIGASYKIR